MKLVKQIPGDNCCGQACIATLLGLSLEDAVKLVGKKGKTSYRDLIMALNRNAWICGTHPGRIKDFSWLHVPYATCLVKVTKGKDRHWIVCHEGKIYDPVSGVHPVTKPPKWMVAADARPKTFVFVSPRAKETHEHYDTLNPTEVHITMTAELPKRRKAAILRDSPGPTPDDCGERGGITSMFGNKIDPKDYDDR